MPLPFDSLSHGRVAFGYFNIDTDLLLLEDLFFFTPAFCALVQQLAGATDGTGSWVLPGHRIPRREDIGDLMGAIHGERFTGFIGEVYRRFPFPRMPDDFKQQPRGCEHHDLVLQMLERVGAPEKIDVRLQVVPGGWQIHLGEYGFSGVGLRQLIQYVWRGGYPRWLDDRRPPEVEALGQTLAACQRGVLAGVELEDLEPRAARRELPVPR